MPDYSDNKFGSRKLRKGSKNQRKGIIDGDGYLKTKVKANLWAHFIKEGMIDSNNGVYIFSSKCESFASTVDIRRSVKQQQWKKTSYQLKYFHLRPWVAIRASRICPDASFQRPKLQFLPHFPLSQRLQSGVHPPRLLGSPHYTQWLV